MLFLMNDTVLQLDLETLGPPVQDRQFGSLTLTNVLSLGSELFAEAPLLHRTAPGRAQRLAALIVSRGFAVNAALFEAPHAGCRTDQVQSRLAEVSLEVMAELYAQQTRSALTPVFADRRVWRRMAA